jgi:hypothetical protein
VEIPKPDGKRVRALGIPTLLDRLIEQALLQVLQPRIDPTFSEDSYGFRPGRSAHDAVLRVREHRASGHLKEVKETAEPPPVIVPPSMLDPAPRDHFIAPKALDEFFTTVEKSRTDATETSLMEDDALGQRQPAASGCYALPPSSSNDSAPDSARKKIGCVLSPHASFASGVPAGGDGGSGIPVGPYFRSSLL